MSTYTIPRTYAVERYNAMVDKTFEEIVRLGKEKGGEYAADHDRLDNFRRNAAANGTTVEQCWGIYAGKHWDALQTFIRDRANGVSRVRTEKLSGRVDDLIVYLLLFKARLEEIDEDVAAAAAASNPLPGGSLLLGKRPGVKGNEVRIETALEGIEAEIAKAAQG